MRLLIFSVLIILCLPTLALSQYDILSFNLIDSLYVDEFHYVYPYDMNGDGIDEIVVGGDSRINIYDIASHDIIWQCQALAGSVMGIEIADIEPDGDPDMMIGTLEPYWRHFYVIYDMNVDSIYEWPESMPGTCYNMHFQRLDGIPYLLMSAEGLLKMNLQDLTYEYHHEFELYYNSCYTDSLFYGTYRVENAADDFFYAYAMDYDFQSQYFNQIIGCDCPEYVEGSYAYADFSDSPGIELIFVEDCVIERDTATLNMYIWDSELNQIDYLDYHWLIEPFDFSAINIVDDSHPELLVKCTHFDFPSQPINVLFDGNGSLIAQSNPGIAIRPRYIGNFDSDPYDEIITTTWGNLFLYDPEVTTAGIAGADILPNDIGLAAYPNPFNASTSISYSLPYQADVNLNIYNISGQIVTTLVDQTQPAGHYKVNWYAGDIPSGVYFFRLMTGNEVKTSKMVLMK